MAKFPNPIRETADLDYKLGIKSSLNRIASVIALTYVLFKANDNHAHLEYSEEYVSNGLIKIRLKSHLIDKIISLFPQISSEEVNKTPLLYAQMEALQVGLQLIYKLAKISFVDGSTFTKERTGGNRYAKQLDFGTNILILDTFLSAFPPQDVAEELANWVNNNSSKNDSAISVGIRKLCTIFSEDVPAKIRTSKGDEIIFKQQGVYEQVLKGEHVVGSDAKENVGTFRVFNSIFKEGIHPYIENANGLYVRHGEEEELQEYALMVDNAASMLPKRTVISTETIVERVINMDGTKLPDHLQVIYYGAPGTGKSHAIDEQCPDDATIRTTFHPDTDYASFVGAYKPTMADVPINSIYGESVQFATGKNGHPGTEKKIVYKYVPQAFLKAYVAAWKRIVTGDPYFLVIEEINRGNCAQIFGDLFQLLDRNNQGASSYAITADEDITQYLANDSNGFAGFAAEEKNAIRDFVLIKDSGERVALGEDILLGKKLLLPPNLRIWATMNTSDQSLFPIDSAFKRRWNWKYIPIDYTKKQWQLEVDGVRYWWADFLRKINPLIHTLTESADKQMGYFFTKADKKTSDESKENDLISEDIFLNKVLFYLWTDVLKDFDAGQEPFIDSETNTTYIFSDFFDLEKGKTKIAEFVSKLELTPVGNGESDVAKIAAEVADDAKRSRLSVTFPGERPMNDGKISDIYVATLERIGLDRVLNVLKERTRKLPLITKEKIETNDTARRYRQVGDYYILLGPDVYPYHPTLRILNDELSLGLNVQWDETAD